MMEKIKDRLGVAMVINLLTVIYVLVIIISDILLNGGDNIVRYLIILVFVGGIYHELRGLKKYLEN